VSDGRGAGCDGVVVAAVDEAAARGGLRAGDRIVELNGVTPLDVLDVEDAAADGTLWVRVLRDGHPLDLVVAPRHGEWHGISLDRGGLGDDPRVCRNRCRFCFVDQVPAGLRAGLSVKDDDYRLSFLHGNFMTLTNLSEADLERIEELRLSPLFVSLHAWDDAARVRLMGRAAAGSRATLERLTAGGLDVHLQVVLCPGWNDAEVLAETVARTGALDGAADLGVVPVSLAAEGDLSRVTADVARAVIAEVERWQRDFLERRGAAFVHAADEFYLLVGTEPPPGDAPEQYENGVGISAALRAEAEALAAGWRGGEAGERDVPPPSAGVTGVRLLTGTLARPVVQAAAAVLETAAGARVRPFAVENALFGPHVTVTGLLGGAEVLEALRRDPLAEGEWLAAPRVWLPEELGRTLDDVAEAELAAACGGRLAVAETLGDAFARLSE
jgi:putative radical SAM enzyme (TIGR03279 family)